MSFAKKNDILAQKKSRLAAYNSQFDTAVGLITSTIDQLGSIVAGIDTTIQEIDDYQNELAATRSNLCDAKEKNQRVIQNFQALLN